MFDVVLEEQPDMFLKHVLERRTRLVRASTTDCSRMARTQHVASKLLFLRAAPWPTVDGIRDGQFIAI